jgi:peptidoglycan/xylan/chitin deacetylase (PgdA/CDA1 family)
LLAALGSEFMEAMWRPLLLVSAAGKIAAVLLWTLPPWRWAAAGCFFLPDLWLAYQVFVPSAQGICPVFTRFETPRAEIWLTIDDGPDEHDTPRILDLLDRYSARATFFLIGERAERHPRLVAETVRRGHEIGHHTQTHPVASFWCAGPARVGRELDRGLRALRTAGGEPRWFRAPVGIKSPFLGPALRRRGLRCVGWSVRSCDTVSRDPNRVAARVMRAVRPGAIVLLHEGPSLEPRVRVRALEQLLVQLAARQFACVLPAPESLRPPGRRDEPARR